MVIADLNNELGAAVINEINSDSGQTIYVRTNISEPEDCENLVSKTIEKFGALHFAINKAGVSSAGVRTGAYDISRWNQEIAVNINGVFYGMRHQIPEILKTGGAIVNIS